MARRARKRNRGLTDGQQAAYFYARRDRRELIAGGTTAPADGMLDFSDTENSGLLALFEDI